MHYSFPWSRFKRQHNGGLGIMHFPKVFPLERHKRKWSSKEGSHFRRLNHQVMMEMLMWLKIKLMLLVLQPCSLTLSHPLDAYCHMCRKRLLKTSWQYEKLLKTSNFSFCHKVFNFFQELYLQIYRDFPYIWVDIFKVVSCRFDVCGKGLN